ncbi:uncharacterized protein LOC110816484 isoform X1 [Carica papaya]|uniref:uncharacterized protein LOC110816484 isoform X1 n=1 Tax=Carica papaya TaxID=3649 RepID=UPI000B8CF133|nr:uncharacterized protein LOC110816484 isoform X1 [Carica papaya]XP_021900386.1 uncharacterized protein LOC110816484 isoform X1 [Carica papaya]
MQSLKNSSMHSQDSSTLRPKGTMLERAIRELEKIVAESRPVKLEVQDGDTSSIAVKRRLPSEVKQKLAKVARLAQSSQGKISDELINRLMSILGHLVQLRTLKRNLREMVLLGLSAKREKADRFEQIKKEVTEMIKPQAARQIDAQTNDFQVALGSEGKEATKGKYTMDSAVEDKICDLYDLYVQGMDEDKGPQIRKLYVELAELWPNGAMDNHGIKSAICRAKERRRVLYGHEKVQGHDRSKKPSTLKMEGVVQGEVDLTSHQKAVRERPISESSNHIFPLSTEIIYTTAIGEQNVGGAAKMGSPSLKGSTMNLHKQVKPEKIPFPMSKEQMKQQQPELESRVRKLSLKPVRESHKPHKRSVGQLDGLNHQSAASPSCGRSD